MVCPASQHHYLAVDILEGLNPMGFRDGLFTVFKGYIDESGDQRNVFTLSCVLGKGSNWDFFQHDWDDVIDRKNKQLEAEGRSRISRYHASDCNWRRGEFADWSTEEQIEFTKQLVSVFGKPANGLTVVAYSINLLELVKTIPETRADPVAFSYALLLMCLVREIGEMFEQANRGKTSRIRVSLIHDRTTRYDHILLRAFNTALNSRDFPHKRMFASLTPMGWEDCPFLQSADLLAFENFKEDERQEAGRDMRKSLAALLDLESFGGRAKGFDRAALLRLKVNLTEELKQQILRDALIAKRH